MGHGYREAGWEVLKLESGACIGRMNRTKIARLIRLTRKDEGSSLLSRSPAEVMTPEAHADGEG